MPVSRKNKSIKKSSKSGFKKFSLKKKQINKTKKNRKMKGGASSSNKKLTDEAFKDLEKFNNTLSYSKKLRYNIDDKIYFMYKLRENPDLVKNTGYTKYSFDLKISEDDKDGDSIYELTITDNKTGEVGIYTETVGRFD